ncbi:MAG: polyprenyl synthetase family protein, partial [Chloroflexota bacterium]
LRRTDGPLAADAPNLLPRVAMLSYKSAGGRSPGAGIRAAAAVALLMAAANVLDDLHDEPRAYSQEEAASECDTVCALLLLSGRALHGTRELGVESDRVMAAHEMANYATLRALAGEVADVEASGAANLSVDEAFRITQEKAGALGRLAGCIGAALASKKEDVIQAHGDFGFHMAVVGQLINDVSAVRPGGSPSTDLELFRKTPPIAFALSLPSGVNRFADEVRRAYSSKGSHDEEVEALREGVSRSGGVHYVWMRAAGHRAQAIETARRISEVCPDSELTSVF